MARSRSNQIINSNDYIILIEKFLEKEELYYDYEKWI